MLMQAVFTSRSNITRALRYIFTRQHHSTVCMCLLGCRTYFNLGPPIRLLLSLAHTLLHLEVAHDIKVCGRGNKASLLKGSPLSMTPTSPELCHCAEVGGGTPVNGTRLSALIAAADRNNEFRGDWYGNYGRLSHGSRSVSVVERAVQPSRRRIHAIPSRSDVLYG